jgi:small subunit ribosomal protein S7
MFIAKLMFDGKKSTAERIFKQALDIIQDKTKQDPFEVFNKAIKNARPLLEVKSRRVGGATYQVPIEVRKERSNRLAMSWIILNSREKKGRPMEEKLAQEILDASNNVGAAIKKKEDTHRMAEANKAFSHFRW